MKPHTPEFLRRHPVGGAFGIGILLLILLIVLFDWNWVRPPLEGGFKAEAQRG